MNKEVEFLEWNSNSNMLFILWLGYAAFVTIQISLTPPTSWFESFCIILLFVILAGLVFWSNYRTNRAREGLE